MGFGATLVYGGQLTLDGQMEVGVYSVLVFLIATVVAVDSFGSHF